MIGRAIAAASALVSLAACATYSGGARSLDPLRLTAEPGWIVAGPTPELHQQGEYDCGAAALAMVAGRWRVPLSLDKAVAELPAPTAKGTRLGDLRNTARAHGLTAFAVTGDRDTLVHELHVGRPVIVGLALPTSDGRTRGHYEVVVAMHPAMDEFVTLDPALGARTRSWANLDAEWHPVGRPALVVLGLTAPATLAERGPRVARAVTVDMQQAAP